MNAARRHSDNVRRTTALIVIVASLIGLPLATLIGVAMSTALRSESALIAAALVVEFSVFGGLVFFIAYKTADARRRSPQVPSARRKEKPLRHPPAHQPAPFDRRLARFVRHAPPLIDQSVSDDDALDPPSRMPFWSIVDPRTWHGPKPAALIRRLLERIRDAVRGTGRG